jgi:hypothetical protein
VNVADVSARLAEIRRRIDAVEREAHVPVGIVAVTKGWDATAISAAVAAGASAIGENYAQELASKRDAIAAAQPEVHFIGRLQTNKVRLVATLVDRWSSVDRDALVDVIARHAPGARVLIQVDPFGTDGKGGCQPAAAAPLARRATDAGLIVEGLMTVGSVDASPDELGAGFAHVRALCDDLGLGVCSMGMTADLEIAVAAGSTEVRVGTALFGPRSVR